MKKIGFAASLLCALTATPLFANVNLPEQCPSIQSIIKAGFDDAVRSSDDSSEESPWNVFKKQHRYDTEENWTTLILVPAANKKEAFSRAFAALNNTDGLDGPAEVENSPDGVSRYACYAFSMEENPSMVITVTPPMEIDQITPQFKRFNN